MSASGHSMAARARHLGRQRSPIRLGNPSKRIGSGLVPYPTDGGIARQVWFEGELQFELLSILMADRRLMSIDTEAPELEWWDGLQWHRFAPQFVVHLEGGVPTIYQTQWHATVSEFRLSELIGMIRPFARAAGYGDVVLETDIELRAPPQLYNADLKTAAAAAPVDGSKREQVLVRLHASGGQARSIAELTENIVSSRPEVLRLAARMLFDEELALLDPKARIGPEALVTAGINQGEVS